MGAIAPNLPIPAAPALIAEQLAARLNAETDAIRAAGGQPAEPQSLWQLSFDLQDGSRICRAIPARTWTAYAESL